MSGSGGGGGGGGSSGSASTAAAAAAASALFNHSDSLKYPQEFWSRNQRYG